MKRVDIVNAIYNAYDEDARLTKSRNGQLESITTMRYIHALLPEGAKVLEVGAGTGATASRWRRMATTFRR